MRVNHRWAPAVSRGGCPTWEGAQGWCEWVSSCFLLPKAKRKPEASPASGNEKLPCDVATRPDKRQGSLCDGVWCRAGSWGSGASVLLWYHLGSEGQGAREAYGHLTGCLGLGLVRSLQGKRSET